MVFGSTLQFVLLAVLLMLSALFSSSETALMTLSKIKLRHMVEEKVKGAGLVQKLVDNPNKLLGAILVGNNIVNIAASAIATSLAISYFGNKGVGISTISMTFIVLIFAEITPKSLAAQKPEKVSLRLSKVIYFLMLILNPLTKVIILITNFLVRILGGKSNFKKALITEEELKTMINISHEEGILEVEERQMIHNVFEFTDIRVKSVMVPRIDVCFLKYESTYEEVIKLFRDEQYSRLPVYKESPDNIEGILNIKDLLFLDDPSQFDIGKILKEPHFTYEFKRSIELLEEMRMKKTRMAVVLDEYGVTAGIVTIEDLVEEIVGEIEDEYDDEKEQIKVISENEYIVDGNTRIDQINELLGILIESDDFDTIGGFIIGEMGHLPETNEILEFNEITFEIIKIKKNRIEKLKIKTNE
ncbi:MAG: HlyC/CorC family transporter [Clostridiales bacterium]|nr:HlyC/CorC family transporter [Clostridiales bacterium]